MVTAVYQQSLDILGANDEGIIILVFLNYITAFHTIQYGALLNVFTSAGPDQSLIGIYLSTIRY